MLLTDVAEQDIKGIIRDLALTFHIQLGTFLGLGIVSGFMSLAEGGTFWNVAFYLALLGGFASGFDSQRTGFFLGAAVVANIFARAVYSIDATSGQVFYQISTAPFFVVSAGLLGAVASLLLHWKRSSQAEKLNDTRVQLDTLDQQADTIEPAKAAFWHIRPTAKEWGQIAVASILIIPCMWILLQNRSQKSVEILKKPGREVPPSRYLQAATGRSEKSGDYRADAPGYRPARDIPSTWSKQEPSLSQDAMAAIINGLKTVMSAPVSVTATADIKMVEIASKIRFELRCSRKGDYWTCKGKMRMSSPKRSKTLPMEAWTKGVNAIGKNPETGRWEAISGMESLINMAPERQRKIIASASWLPGHAQVSSRRCRIANVIHDTAALNAMNLTGDMKLTRSSAKVYMDSEDGRILRMEYTQSASGSNEDGTRKTVQIAGDNRVHYQDFLDFDIPKEVKELLANLPSANNDPQALERDIRESTPTFEYEKYAHDLCSRGDYDSGARAYNHAIKLYPGSATAYGGRGVCNLQKVTSENSAQNLMRTAYLRRAEWTLAARDCRKALLIGMPGVNSGNIETVSREDCEGVVELAEQIAARLKALRSQGHESNPSRRAIEYARKGYRYEERGEHLAAVLNYTRAIELSPSPEWYARRGIQMNQHAFRSPSCRRSQNSIACLSRKEWVDAGTDCRTGIMMGLSKNDHMLTEFSPLDDCRDVIKIADQIPTALRTLSSQHSGRNSE